VLVFISGAVRSGKSSLGERLAANFAGENRKIYLATAKHYDEEITRRIKNHQQNRADKGFLTIDKSYSIGDLAAVLRPEDTVLLDCLGTLLANEMFEREGSPSALELENSEANDSELSYYEAVGNKIFEQIMLLNKKVANFIVISNEIFGDGIVYAKSIEAYRKTLAKLHIKLVEKSDLALECVYAGYHCHKGKLVKAK